MILRRFPCNDILGGVQALEMMYEKIILELESLSQL